MIRPSLVKNDPKAKMIIWLVSGIVFFAVVFLANFRLKVNLGFDPHLFAKINALINSVVSFLLVAGMIAIKQKKFTLHKNIMMTAIVLSVIFLLSYICHHLFAGETRFGDLNHDGILSPSEKTLAGNLRILYYIILILHIPLAAIILPFILFTSYRALIGEYEQHKKLVRFTWPIWFFVAVSGVIVYLMISPYYV
jgi:putative membrane protein